MEPWACAAPLDDYSHFAQMNNRHRFPLFSLPNLAFLSWRIKEEDKALSSGEDGGLPERVDP